MQEIYRQQDFEYSERVRFYHDFNTGRPFVPEYVPPEGTVPTSYPGIPRPMFFRDTPPRTDEASSSSSPTAQEHSGYPWDMSSVAQGLYGSLFPQFPPPPQ